MGVLSFCTDLAEDRNGRPHIAYMFNMHVYGEPISPEAEPGGMWSAWRDVSSGAWTKEWVGEQGIAGFTTCDDVLRLFLAGNGAIQVRVWSEKARSWGRHEPVLKRGDFSKGPGFLDTLSAGSGCVKAPGPVIVTDTTIEDNDAKYCVTWALFITEKN